VRIRNPKSNLKINLIKKIGRSNIVDICVIINKDLLYGSLDMKFLFFLKEKKERLTFCRTSPMTFCPEASCLKIWKHVFAKDKLRSLQGKWYIAKPYIHNTTLFALSWKYKLCIASNIRTKFLVHTLKLITRFFLGRPPTQDCPNC
jgi:hypothetical protein